MKTKIKRHSRAVISVILAISMLVSCMMVGLIATDAAKVTGDEEVGATTYRYLWYDMTSNNGQLSALTNKVTLSSTDGNYYTGSFASTGSNVHFIINNSDTTHTSSLLNSTTTVTVKGSVASWTRRYENSGSYGVEGQLASGNTYYIGYNVSTNTVIVGSSSSDISSGGSGGGGGGSVGTDLQAVLKGTKVMFYAGMSSSYTTTKVYLYNNQITGSNHGKTPAASNAPTVTKTLDSKTFSLYPFTIASGTYYLGEQNWAPREAAMSAGGTYVIHNATISATGFTQAHQYDYSGTRIFSYDAGSTKTATTTVTGSILEGNTISVSTSTSAGKSSLGNSNSFKYYIAKGTGDYTEYTLSNGKIDTSSLSAGTYTLKTVLYDGNIYVVADTDSFTINAETKYAVTFSATNGSIIPNGSNNIGITTKTDISATANTGYTFSEWQTAGVTMTNDTANGDGRTAKVVSTATPNTRYVKAIFEKKTLNISVTQPTAGGTISSDKSTAQVGDTVTITAVPATGYSLSEISYSSTAGSGTASGTGNTRTFTMPGADTDVTATFAKTNYTISKTVNPEGSGTVAVKKTNSSGEEVSQYNIGDTLYLTASANAAYTFKDFTVTYGDGTTETKANNTTIDMTGKTGNITVQGNFTKKPTYKVAVKSNDTSWGTLTASPAEAYQGQTVTITAVENTGTFSKMSFTGITKQDVTTKTATFTMPGNAVTVNATFTEYSANSNFYYNSYGSDGQPAATHYGARMTEAKLNGETYSYYHVTGRSETDQLFTVSYKSPVYNGKQAYFEIWSSWESGGVKAQFYTSDGNNLGDYADMTYDTEANEKKKFKIVIPDGAKSVQFKHGSNTTGTLSLTDGYNAWYTNNKNGTLADVTGYNSDNPVPKDFWENFNGTKYTNAFNSGGFNSHNANRGASHAYTKPNNLDASQRGDYYVLVLYKGKTYTINGVEKTISNDPEIIWLPELPDNSDKAIIYAKDGTLRSGSQTFANHATTVATSGGTTGTRKDNDYSLLKLEKDGSTVTVTTTIDEGDWRNNYFVKGFNINGVTPTINTPSNNGEYTVEFKLEEDKITCNNGDVEIPYINDKYVEITPIYYLKDLGEAVTFYVRGYDDSVKESWGDTIAAYPFYNGVGGTDCAFGGYPGQPMINYGGKRYIDIPKYVTVGGNQYDVQGITLSNNYWDRIHGTTTSEGNLLHVKAVTTHAQTYDYDDFSKIFSEVKENNKTPDTIVFDFKYRTAYNNERSTTLGSTSTYKNGWNDLVNAQSEKVDIFGNVLEGADLNKPAIYAVSDGYWNEYSGAYSTEWHLYTNAGAYIGTINPSVRWIQTVDNVSDSVYTYQSDRYDKTTQVTLLDAYKNTYNTLKSSYLNVPVKVTYEKEIRNESGNTDWDTYESKHGSKSGDFGKVSDDSQKAKRSDGIWLYSFNGTKINANTVIEYSDDDGSTYTEDPYVDDTNTSTKGMKAYFTNDDFNGKTSVQTRSNKEDHFTFTAESAGEYIFVGWWLRESDGTDVIEHKISKLVDAESTMESGGTFVARFIKNPSGQLTLSHTVLKDSTYKGDATTTITVQVSDESLVDPIIYTVSGKSEFTIPTDYIKYGHNYKIDVMLTTVPTGDDIHRRFYTEVDNKFYNNPVESIPGTEQSTAYSLFSFYVDDLFEYDSVTDHYNQTTKILRYYSQLEQIKYHYEITYSYTSYRDQKGTQYYKVVGDFTEDDIKNYLEKSNNVYDQDTRTNVTAYSMEDDNKRDAFINKYGPYENNFLKKISWNTKKRDLSSEDTDEQNGMHAEYKSSSRTYLIDVNAKEYGNNQVTLEIYLPYNHYTEADNNYDPIATGDKYIFDDDTETIKLTNLNQMMWYATNNVKNYSNPTKQPKFVTAPQVLYKNDSPLIFRYWSVKKLESDTNTNKVEYTRCFSNEFNLSLYQNTYIEPVYTDPTDAENASGKYASAHDNAVASGMGATITFMENSRNQYNEGMCGTETISSRQLQGDRVFTDFLISFANPQDIQYATYAAGTYSAGIVVERVAKLDKNQMGDFVTMTEEEYKDKYGSEVTNDKLTDITAFIEKTGKYSDGKAYRDGTEKYDTNPQGVIKYQKSEVDAKTLDNKNRMDFYYSMSVRNHSGDFVDNHNADYVYRAYSYIKDSSGKVVMLSGDPLYFTIYDMASIANATEGKTYDKPKTS